MCTCACACVYIWDQGLNPGSGIGSLGAPTQSPSPDFTSFKGISCRLLPLEPAHSSQLTAHLLCLVITRVDDVTSVDYSLVAPLTTTNQFLEGQLKVRLPETHTCSRVHSVVPETDFFLLVLPHSTLPCIPTPALLPHPQDPKDSLRLPITQGLCTAFHLYPGSSVEDMDTALPASFQFLIK